MEIQQNGWIKVKKNGLIKAKAKKNGLVRILIISYSKDKPTTIERKKTHINKTMDNKIIHNKKKFKTIQNLNLATTMNQIRRVNNLDIRNGHDRE